MAITDLNSILKLWNSLYGDRLPLSNQLLEATFLNTPEEARTVFMDENIAVFAKKDEDILRIHLAVPLKIEAQGVLRETIQNLTNRAHEWRCRKIVFGGGDDHIFPGIPLLREQENWLPLFKQASSEVADFEGNIDTLIARASDKQANDQTEFGGQWRAPQNMREALQIIEFVRTEFNGRWLREICRDSALDLMEHYYGYFLKGEVVAYARLYGWRDDYWAPGVYFAAPAQGVGGLGPIGVAANMRGSGLGTHILEKSWPILAARSCRKVRIDWTTETAFYERLGLSAVQKYQPAELSL